MGWPALWLAHFRTSTSGLLSAWHHHWAPEHKDHPEERKVIFFFSFSVFWIFEFYFTYFLYGRFLLVIYFIHFSDYMSIPISQFITPPPPPLGHVAPLVSIYLSSTSVSLFLPCKPVHLYHFSRFHIYVLIYDICFSLSDLLHSVWQSLDPSTSL